MRNKIIVAPDFPTLTLSVSPKTFSHSKIIVLSKVEGELEKGYRESFKEMYNSIIAFLDTPKITDIVKIVSKSFEETPEDYLSPLWFERSINIQEQFLFEVFSKAKYESLYLPAGLLNPVSIKLTRYVLNHYNEFNLENKRIVVYAERPALDFYLLRWEFDDGIKGKYRDVFSELYNLWKKVYSKFGPVKYFYWGGGLELDYNKFQYGNELLAPQITFAVSKQEVLEKFRREMLYTYQEEKNV